MSQKHVLVGIVLVVVLAVAAIVEALADQKVMAVVSGLLAAFAAWVVWRASRTIASSR
jgi:hypothetical protein